MGKQRLSSRAAAAKKKRDLMYANSDRRKKMRAENQRLRRAAKKAGKKIDGKDYDHKTKRFVSVKKTEAVTDVEPRKNNFRL